MVAKHIENLQSGWPYKALAALLITLLGPWTDAHQALLILILIDTVLGIWVAVKTKDYCPEKGILRMGTKFGVIFFILAAAFQIQLVLRQESGEAMPVVRMVIAFLSVHEFTSISTHVKELTGISLGSLIAKIAEASGVKKSNG